LHRFDTDQECNGRTDIWTMVKTREALHAIARNKFEVFNRSKNKLFFTIILTHSTLICRLWA